VWLSGNWTTLPTGFNVATVATSGGTGAPSSGDKAYFLEFPNTMLLVKPQHDDSRVMVCAASAVDEPTQGKYIYVNIPEHSWGFGSPAYGTVEATRLSAGRWTFKITSYELTGEVLSSAVTNTFDYLNGTFTDESTPSDATKVFMTPSGVFMGDSGPNRGGFAGAGLLTPSSFSTEFGHTFKGVRFIYDSGLASGETESITVTKSATMDALLASSYDNVETGTTPGPGVMITFEAQQSTGFRRGYVTDLGDGHSETIQCGVSLIGPAGNQKYMLFGIGHDNLNRSFNFLIIQTD
jgi:hypothetical protein